MPIKLIAVDMDDTFLTCDKRYDVALFKKLHQAFHDQGIIWLIASGNSYHNLEVQFDQEDKKHLYFAGDNGSFIVKNDQVLHTSGIDRALALDIIHYIQEHGDISTHVCTGRESYILKGDPFLDEAKIYNRVLYEIDSFDDIPEDKTVYKIAIINDTHLDDNKSLAEAINQRYDGIFSVTSGNIYIDILNEESGKGHAVSYLQDKYNITPEETICFGDSMNDASMMPLAKYSIGMANADPDLLDLTTYKIGTSDEQAVLKLLNRFYEEGHLDFIEDYKQ